MPLSHCISSVPHVHLIAQVRVKLWIQKLNCASRSPLFSWQGFSYFSLSYYVVGDEEKLEEVLKFQKKALVHSWLEWSYIINTYILACNNRSGQLSYIILILRKWWNRMVVIRKSQTTSKVLIGTPKNQSMYCNKNINTNYGRSIC